MWTKTEDGSVLDSVGNVIVFSTERFIRDRPSYVLLLSRHWPVLEGLGSVVDRVGNR
jgi:hypothetical protein